jgi:arylsulfatase A-like enzyme
LAWIRRDDPRPWFCFVNLYDVHWPYVPAADVAGPPVRAYGGPMDGYLFRSDALPAGFEPGPEDDRHVADLYDAEMWDLDRRVDAFLEALDLDRSNTAVLLTSDHGEAFGEGGRYQHEDILEPQVRIPMMIRMPGDRRPRGRRPGPVSGVDVAPTLLAMAGLPVPEGMHGVDLLSNGDPPSDRVVLVEDRDQPTVVVPRFVIYQGPWKLVRSGQGEHLSVTLVDLGRDPDGLVDVAADHPERRAAMEELLDRTRAPWAGVDSGLSLTGLGASADALSGLGYLEGAEEP